MYTVPNIIKVLNIQSKKLFFLIKSPNPKVYIGEDFAGST